MAGVAPYPAEGLDWLGGMGPENMADIDAARDGPEALTAYLEPWAAEIHKTATLDAPAEDIFDIVDDPMNFPRYVPNVTNVVDVRRTERRIGDTFRVIYKVLGLTFDEKFTTSEYQRPSRLSSTFKGGMSGTFGWTFEPVGSQTKVSVDIDYSVAGGTLGKAVDSVMLEKTNAKSIEGMLENLRKIAVKVHA
jgi:ribosome-associated toxin RatA of RatAB toxin-antitoxin module